MKGSRTTALCGLGTAAAVVALLRLLVPAVPPLAVLGGDGVFYDAMARHPLHAVVGFPFAARLGMPLLVAALPVSVAHGFLVVGLASIALAGAVVALIAREVGLGLPHAIAASALVAGSYVGVITAYTRYLVDAPLLLGVSVALLFALRRERLAFVCATLLTVFVKEIGVTLVVLPYLLWREPGRLWDRELLRRTLLLAIPALVAFVLLQKAAPHLPPRPGTDRFAGLRVNLIFVRGVVVSTLNPLIALFGGILLAWPLGFLRSPLQLRRAHVWVLLAAPVLVLGSWERTLGPFLPFVVPAALFALADAGSARIAIFTAGSLEATAFAGAQTVGNGSTSVTHKLLLVVPGLLVAAAALVPAYLRAIR